MKVTGSTRRKRRSARWAFIGLNLLVPAFAAGHALAEIHHLTAGRDAASSKPIFQLDGAPFYPLIYSDHFTKFTPEILHQLSAKGVNMVQVAVDTEESDAEPFRKLLDECAQIGMPVLLELDDWKLREVLVKRPDLNMVMSDNVPVKYFPDYANPKTRREHLTRFARASQDIVKFVGRPIVAVSVGAYDAYHLPDGEVHHDFVVPEHTEPDQTRLPYGPHVTEAFGNYLLKPNSDRHIPITLGTAPVSLPTTLSTTRDPALWQNWLLFRRNLVTAWLAGTVDVVRRKTHVPVGVSFDLNFAQREQFATPPFAWSGALDFVSVYCYGKEPDAAYVGPLLRTVWREYGAAGVPMIGLLEFSSALSGNTSGSAYAQACAPFVSGLMTAAPQPEFKHDQPRVDSFIEWARDLGSRELLQMSVKFADLLVVLNREGAENCQSILRECARNGKSVDVVYVGPGWDGTGGDEYRYVVVADDLPLPKDASSASNVRFIRASELATAFADGAGQRHP